MPKEIKKGKLYIVGTPIGNISDISQRAVDTISNADIIACEDTRRSGMLLKKLEISKKKTSYHEHNEIEKSRYLIKKMLEGNDVALITDAGTPCISDPGKELVKACAENCITVVSVPGPCAGILAASASDIDTKRFSFESFIPARGKERKSVISEIALEKRTVILYEAPHRIIKTLKDFSAAGLGKRKITIARELTKIHEEYIRTTVDSGIGHFGQVPPRGEFTLVLEGREMYEKRAGLSDKAPDEKELKELIKIFIRPLLKEGLSVKETAAKVALEFNIPRRKAYYEVQKIKDEKRS